MTQEAGLKTSEHASEGDGVPRALIRDLRCPCCGSRFGITLELRSSRDDLRDGILQCDCYEYPVVGGIVVLRQIGPVSSTRNEAVECLKRHNPSGAVRWLLSNGSATGVPGIDVISAQTNGGARFVRRLWKLLRASHPLLHGDPIPLQSGFQAALQAARPRGYSDYLFHRFANPSFLGILPPLVIFGDSFSNKPTGRVLDLMCGVGHTSATLNVLCPEVNIVAADFDFVNMFLVRHFVAPEIATLCVDAELPLPFVDSSIDGFVCLDGLHYIRSKDTLLREVDRVVSIDGVWLFAHLHNAIAENVNPGVPLSAEGYLKRFIFGQQRLIPEAEILKQFQTGGLLDLTVQSDIRALVASHAFALLGSRGETLWEKHLNLDGALCRQPDLIGLNPIYRVETAPDGLILKSAWPSESLRRECVREITYLPELVYLTQRVVDDIVDFRATGTISAEIRKLLRSFVLVPLPYFYSLKGVLP